MASDTTFNLTVQQFERILQNSLNQSVPLEDFVTATVTTTGTTTTTVGTTGAGQTITIEDGGWGGGSVTISPLINEWVGTVPPQPYTDVVSIPSVWQSPPWEQAVPAPFDFTRTIQSIPLTEDLEMVKECQIEEIHEDGAVVEFRVKGPKIPVSMLERIPEDILKRLDYELKRAMVIAFRLVPPDMPRRCLIIDKEEEK